MVASAANQIGVSHRDRDISLWLAYYLISSKSLSLSPARTTDPHKTGSCGWVFIQGEVKSCGDLIFEEAVLAAARAYFVREHSRLGETGEEFP